MTTSTIDTIRPRILELRDRVRHGGAAATTLTELRALYKEAEDADLIGTAKYCMSQTLIAEPDAPEIEARWAAMLEKVGAGASLQELHALTLDCACDALIEDGAHPAPAVAANWCARGLGSRLIALGVQILPDNIQIRHVA